MDLFNFYEHHKLSFIHRGITLHNTAINAESVVDQLEIQARRRRTRAREREREGGGLWGVGVWGGGERGGDGREWEGGGAIAIFMLSAVASRPIAE